MPLIPIALSTPPKFQNLSHNQSAMKFKPKTQIWLGVAISLLWTWNAFDTDWNPINTDMPYNMMVGSLIGWIVGKLVMIGLGAYFAAQGVKRLRAEKQTRST
jgi:hypothetical protein